jgi:multiple sugar transport system substrate-binding protein
VILDQALSQYLSDELTLEEAMQAIYDGWEEITEELGREDQLAAYRATLGISNK